MTLSNTDFRTCLKGGRDIEGGRRAAGKDPPAPQEHGAGRAAAVALTAAA